ncbi:MAG: Zn-dependent exopeptidase M28 [Planctomycetes bacterium]|nr:Zn-dependent exopeptidase M28 [Planctomycetota bacterium]
MSYLMLLRRSLNRLAPAIVASACIAHPAAGQTVQDVVDQVSEQMYTYYHDQLLYTHDGDNRGFGPEHDLAQSNILDTFAGLGLDASLDPFTYDLTTYYNVVGIHYGLVQPDQVYVIGAHYDSVNNPGADDNASGVAAVMEAAHALSQFDFSDTIVFVAFDREEQRLYGSKAYAVKHQTDDMRAMINLDMIAYNPNNRNRAVIYGRDFCAPLTAALDTAFTNYALAVDGVNTGEYHGNSDHHYFGTFGIQSAWLAEYDVWSNPYYHRQSDSSDTPNYIDYPYATDFVRAIVGYVASEAGLLGDYVLSEPVPGVAGVENTLTVDGATPGEYTYFAYGFTQGQSSITGCPGVYLDINAAVVAGQAAADGTGLVTFNAAVPPAASGRLIWIQALETATCRTSNLIDFLFE